MIDINWNRYALIAELTKRIHSVSPQFGKTALQKLVFFTQEVYKVDCGYDFKLYSYGPFDSQLLSDLDMVAHWGCVSIIRVNDSLGGYRIDPTESVDSIRDRAVEFLDTESTRNALNDLISTYGSMTARDLELRATTVYVAQDLHAKGEQSTLERVRHLVGQLKPKFSSDEIERAAIELNERHHIQITT